MEVIGVMGSERDIFRIYVTAAVFNNDGMIQVEREEWIIAEIWGSSEERQDLTKIVGRGWSWQDLWIRSASCEKLGSVKVEGNWQVGRDSGLKRSKEDTNSCCRSERLNMKEIIQLESWQSTPGDFVWSQKIITCFESTLSVCLLSLRYSTA